MEKPEVCVLGEYGSEPGQFNYPTGLAVSPSGKEVFVADCGNGRIQVFETKSGRFLRAWSLKHEGNEQLPRRVAASHDSVFVCDRHRVSVFRADGSFVCMWSATFNDLRLISWSDGLVFVVEFNPAEPHKDRVQVFRENGARLYGFGMPQRPEAVTFLGDETFVSDESAGISVFDRNGVLLRWWGMEGTNKLTPLALCATRAGTILIAEIYLLREFLPDGTPVRTIPLTRGWPIAIVEGPNEEIWVLCLGLHCIRVLEARLNTQKSKKKIAH